MIMGLVQFFKKNCYCTSKKSAFILGWSPSQVHSTFEGPSLKVLPRALTQAILNTKMNCHGVFKTQEFWHAINTGKTKIMLLLVQGSIFYYFFLINLQNIWQAITLQVTTVISLPIDHIKLWVFVSSIDLNYSYQAVSITVHSWLPIKACCCALNSFWTKPTKQWHFSKKCFFLGNLVQVDWGIFTFVYTWPRIPSTPTEHTQIQCTVHTSIAYIFIQYGISNE